MPKRKRSSEKPGCLVHWFRKGLRLHDNPALKEGLKGASGFRCIYILDPWFAGSCSKGVNRWRFLLECLEDLDSSLRRLNSRLFLVRGQPADVLPRLFKEWKVTKLSFEEDSEPFGRTRDKAISTLAQEAGVKVISKVSHTLYDPQEILALNNNEPPLTYKRFQDIISMMGIPVYPVDALEAEDVEGLETFIGPNHDDKYGIPTLEELGFDTEDVPPAVWVGGETEAKQRLDRHLERKAWVANFERPRMSPASLMASPAGLSPYLRFGCLSPRTFYWRLTELYQKVRKTTNTPLSLHGQLLWREFFFTVACNNRMFDRMVDNPICIQIPWDKDQTVVNKWANGESGFPWIDAIMTQLRLEGWIHPLARHAVACFLTRGDLWISWEEGMKVFDEYLLDADWSVNAGNWIWLSCSSFFQQFFHCYCPVKFGRRTDPNGDYVRKYLPILKNFPSKYIFEPWTAPEEVQEKAKCIIGKDYPFPIVDHAEASHRNIERMRKVYNNLSSHGGPGLLGSVPSSKEASGPPQRAPVSDSSQLHRAKHHQQEMIQTFKAPQATLQSQVPPTKQRAMSRNMSAMMQSFRPHNMRHPAQHHHHQHMPQQPQLQLHPAPMLTAQHPLTSATLPLTSAPLPLTSVPLPLTSVPLPLTSVPLPLSSSSHPLSSAQHPLTSSPLPIMSAQHPLTSAPLPLSSAPHPLSTAPHLLSSAPHPLSTVPHLLSSAQLPLPTAPHPQLMVTQHLQDMPGTSRMSPMEVTVRQGSLLQELEDTNCQVQWSFPKH